MEDKLILGTLLVCEGLLTLSIARIAYHTKQVKIATTNFLDTATSYFSSRASKPKDIKGLADLSRYRTEIRYNFKVVINSKIYK